MVSAKVYLKSSVIVLLLCLISCASKKPTTLESEKTIEQPKVIYNNKILIINYLLTKNAQDQKSISLINKINTEGNLKERPKKPLNTTIGDLQYALLDADLKEIEIHTLKNPLKKTVEFVNDFGNFEKRILDLDSVQFSIRLQLPENAKHIVISEITNKKPIQLLSTKIE